MRKLDTIAIEEVGILSLVLMESAGRAVADVVTKVIQDREHELKEPTVLAIAGLGNNGGDAVVSARLLMNRGVDIDLVIIGERNRTSRDLETQLRIAEQIGLRPRFLGDEDASDLDAMLKTHAIIIDGIFGTGLERPIEGRLARVIDRINTSGAFVVAIDLPSGIHSDTGTLMGTAVEADITVTLGLPKIGLWLYPGRAHAGIVEIADIGIPYVLLERAALQAELLDASVLTSAFSPRDRDAHKGTFGHVVIVAGTSDRPGSALLAARAALRTGAGLVTIASDNETIARLSPAFEAIMGATIGDHHVDPATALSVLHGKSAFAIGMSLSGDEPSGARIRDIVLNADVPCVLDAGAIDAFCGDPTVLARRAKPTVLTPHPGEMARLMGADVRSVQRDRVGVTREAAKRTGAIVVHKGASTVIAEPGGIVGIVPTGNAGMATAGTGDVLAGMIASLLAQGCAPALSARAAAFLHGLAGDRAATTQGEWGLTAVDLLEHMDPRLDEDEA